MPAPLRSPKLTAAAASCLLALSACGPKSGPGPNPGPDQKSAARPVVFLQNGLTPDQRKIFYHEPEGSELVSLALLKSIINPATHAPFIEGMDRFGLIPDDPDPVTNPDGLPVGITAAASKVTPSLGKMTGFNCSACHVGEMTYKGTRIRIDGAPNMLDLEAYQREFGAALQATLNDPSQILPLVARMDQNGLLGPSAPSKLLARFNGAVKGDLEKAFSNVARNTAAKADAGPAPARVANPYATAAPVTTEDRAAVQAVAALDTQPGTELDSKSSGERADMLAHLLARVRAVAGMLKNRAEYFEHGKSILVGTDAGPGRVDAFGAAQNFLFPANARDQISPVSFPFIWDYQSQEWLHYDGNTPSVIERNIGQAVGMGASFDPRTFHSSLLPHGLLKLEQAAASLQPPQWPEATLGAIDRTKAAHGEGIYKEKCLGCHNNGQIDLATVGTDPERALTWASQVGTPPQDLAKAVTPVLDRLKLQMYADAHLSASEIQALEGGRKDIWRTTKQYQARRHRAMWASAPYLHNASVPTLWDLLTDADKRPRTFYIGNREFDPVKVGYVSAPGGPHSFLMDTSRKGNGNGGHTGDRFGTTLPDSDKWALIEYLKTL